MPATSYSSRNPQLAHKSKSVSPARPSQYHSSHQPHQYTDNNMHRSKSASPKPYHSLSSSSSSSSTNSSRYEYEYIDHPPFKKTGFTLRDHLKAISYIDKDAKDPCLNVTPQGIFECRVCFNAFANERRYREHTKTPKHREFVERGFRAG